MLERFVKQTKYTSQEDFIKNFKIEVPENFNFGYDVVDAWAVEQPDKKAILWTNDQGSEHQYTFAELKEKTDATASFFQNLGIGHGDMVMLILKRRIEFWFCTIALHKLGAVVIPATHLLTKKDIVYRCNAADIKMIVCAGEEVITKHIIDAMPDSPTVNHLISIGPDMPEGCPERVDWEFVKEIWNYTLEQVLAEEKWDYISVQQVSSFSGMPETYNPWLPELLEFVKARQPQAEIMFHMTWAYAPNSDHGAFPNYDRDQMKMYNAIVSAVYQETPKVGIKLVIPSGTAIQNARTSFLGDDLTRDGFHLSRPHGRYIAACTWLEAVLGKNPVGNTYRPEGMTEEEVKVAQKAAHKAVKKPRKVSKIK